MQDNLEELARENADRWVKESVIGEELQGIQDMAMPILEREIFREIETEALNTLKNPDLDLSNLNQLYQIRALAQTIDLIRKRMALKIQQGKNARAALKQMNSTQKEGEL